VIRLTKPYDIMTWDWRYKIGLQPSLKQTIRDKINILPKKQKELYQDLIFYFNQYISLHSILEKLHSPTEKQWDQLNFPTISLTKGKLLWIPPLIQEPIERLMNEIIVVNPQFEDILRELFDHGVHAGKVPDYKQQFSIIFGHYFPKVIDHANNLAPFSYQTPKQMIDEQDILPFAEKTLDEIIHNETINQAYGTFNIENYETTIKKNIGGFAEFWPREINDNNTDELVLIINENSLNYADLELTLYHEVYPGHGHFYEWARNKRSFPFFDHGANALIEGWATYVEWHTVNNEYARYLRANAKRNLELLKANTSKQSVNEKLETLYNDSRRSNTENQAKYSLIYFSQYPGFLESYYLGAYWLDYKITAGDFSAPKDFLQHLVDQGAWGDFFKLW